MGNSLFPSLRLLPTPAAALAQQVGASTRYRVDWARFTTLMLPPALRRPRLRAWVRALTWPLHRRYVDVLAWMTTMRREATYNGQTIMLEQALNDQFAPLLRDIEVRNNNGGLLPKAVFFADEHPVGSTTRYIVDLPVRTRFVGTEGGPPDLLLLGFDTEFDRPGFTVYAPGVNTQVAATGQITPAQALALRINALKMATTQYTIKYVAAPPR